MAHRWNSSRPNRHRNQLPRRKFLIRKRTKQDANGFPGTKASDHKSLSLCLNSGLDGNDPPRHRHNLFAVRATGRLSGVRSTTRPRSAGHLSSPKCLARQSHSEMKMNLTSSRIAVRR